MADIKTRESLRDSSRAKDIRFDCEIVADLMTVDGSFIEELDVLGWINLNPEATWIVVADPINVDAGDYLVRVRMCHFRTNKNAKLLVPLHRDGLAECYAYEGRLGKFRTHTIESYHG